MDGKQAFKFLTQSNGQQIEHQNYSLVPQCIECIAGFAKSKNFSVLRPLDNDARGDRQITCRAKRAETKIDIFCRAPLCLENLWHREHLEASIQGPFRLVK